MERILLLVLPEGRTDREPREGKCRKMKEETGREEYEMDTLGGRIRG